MLMCWLWINVDIIYQKPDKSYKFSLFIRGERHIHINYVDLAKKRIDTILYAQRFISSTKVR